MSGTATLPAPPGTGMDVGDVLAKLRQAQPAPAAQAPATPTATIATTAAVPPPSADFAANIAAESGGHQFGPDGKPLHPAHWYGDPHDPPTGESQAKPSSAREALAAIGQPFDLERFNNDSDYNIYCGNLYKNQMLARYGNNRLLADAAYNAGPGRVDAWIKEFGDPRTGKISNEEFGAQIPFDETRAYLHATGALIGDTKPAASVSGGGNIDLPFNTKKIFDDLRENMWGAKQEGNKELSALEASMAKMQEPPPQTQPTPASEQWGGAAMALAAIGGLLTRRPAATAMGAMAGVLNAYKEGDATRQKQAMDQWKAAHDAMIDATNLRMKMYENAMKKYQSAPAEAKAELEANAAALQDVAVQDALKKGDVQTAMAIISGGYSAAVTAQRESIKFQQQMADRAESQKLIQDLAAARASGDPEKVKAAQDALQDHLAVVAPPTAAARIELPSTKPTTASAQKEQDNDVLASAKFRELYGRDPGPNDTVEMAKLRQAQRQEPGQSALSSTAIATAADYYNLTHQFPPGMRDKADRDAVLDAAAERLKESGGDASSQLQTVSGTKAAQASLVQITKQKDAATAFERSARKELDLALSLLPKSAEPLDSQLLTRWVRNGEAAMGDPNIPRYQAALISALDEYAKVLTGATGAAGSTDSAREQAASLIPAGATTEQVPGIIEVLKQGMQYKTDSYDEQIKVINDRLGGGGEKPQAATALPPAAIDQLQENHVTTFANGQKWTLKNGQPSQVP